MFLNSPKIKNFVRAVFSNRTLLIIILAISIYNAWMLRRIYNQSDFGGVYDSFRETNEKIDGISGQIESLQNSIESNDTKVSSDTYPYYLHP